MSGSAPTERWALTLRVNDASPTSLVSDLSGSVQVRPALDLGTVDADDTRTALSG